MAKKKLTYETAMKIVTETFLADVNSTTDPTALKTKLVEAQLAMREIGDAECDDSQLTAARELAKDLVAGNREALKQERAKIVVCLSRLEELGRI